jgi:hypothetical protein
VPAQLIRYRFDEKVHEKLMNLRLVGLVTGEAGERAA